MKEKEFYEFDDDEEEQEALPAPPRAPAWLAVMRIICVLGMSFGIAFGLFLLLGAWWLTGFISLLAAIPFFVVMRVLEKHAAKATEDSPEAQAT